MENWNLYSKIILEKCFDCIDSNSKVLEIGPSNGKFTKLILEKNPKYLELVEPDYNMIPSLKLLVKEHTNVSIKNKDIFNLLPQYQPKDFDVVVAFGVLYHWASPFDFLEKIANYIRPQYLCIDNPDNDQIRIKPEAENLLGGRWVQNYQTVKMAIHLPPDIITQAVTTLGYTQQLKRQMGYHNVRTKEQSWVWKFKSTSFKNE
jgi:2-polyprenyl-3-methyl-5-hydroxy-6-metoxy-1,4-benzoquinol methylase